MLCDFCDRYVEECGLDVVVMAVFGQCSDDAARRGMLARTLPEAGANQGGAVERPGAEL